MRKGGVVGKGLRSSDEAAGGEGSECQGGGGEREELGIGGGPRDGTLDCAL